MRQRVVATIVVGVLALVLTAQAFAASTIAVPETGLTEGPSSGAVQSTSQMQPSYVVMDAKTGQILAEEGEHVRRPPASITKIMTLLLAIEATEQGKASYTDVVTTSAKAASMGGSQIYLKEGEKMSLEDMLRSVAISSANDASVAVTEHIAGSESVFVQLMNKEAQRLGLTDTHFANSNGLPADDHYSSAYDIAVITRELLDRHPKVLDWTSIKSTTIRNGTYTITNTNPLLGKVDGVNGLKTGWTEAAGYCLSATAARGDETRIVVVMGYPTDEERQKKATELLEYGFRAFVRRNPVLADDTVGKVKVKNGSKLEVDAKASQDMTFLVGLTQTDQVTLELRQEELVAPIKKGDTVGTYVALVDGNQVMSVPVYAAEDVPGANIFVRMWRAITAFFSGLFKKG